MSNSRHPALNEVRSYSITHPPGRVMLPTQPGWDYLVFAKAGLITALTEVQAWTIPAYRVMCVPDGTRVRIESSRRSVIRCLYLREHLKVIRNEVRVINLTPLTYELLIHGVENSPLDLEVASNMALVTLLAAQLANETKAPLHLALPTDSVARSLASAIMADPSGDLDDQIRQVHASRRTVERRFRSETKMSLGQWRRRARTHAAVNLLAQGHSVTDTAILVGYASPSAFVAAFRSELGSAPREFMRI